ncbi:MAG: hypothetical protein M0Q23_06895 [Syntrophales bacterium]|jgi:hypothetical protein|nr:hypothetical protein [Syntrophales bacterium]MCK9528352.1 hypothetical protein [Syntrophales bacterium]MDX9922723.1 hypothetical protein [Syntrophales bacterium]
MVRKQPFQIRSKKDARLLAKDILRAGGDFSYHVPLLGGMEGNYVDIRCDRESASFTILPAIAENSDHQGRGYEELVEHLWKDRKYINAELRKMEPGWLQL